MKVSRSERTDKYPVAYLIQLRNAPFWSHSCKSTFRILIFSDRKQNFTFHGQRYDSVLYIIQLWMLNRQSGVVQSSTCIWSVCVRTRVGFRTHQRNRNIIRFNCLFCVCFGILKLAYEQAHMCDFGEKFWRQFLQGNNNSLLFCFCQPA